PHIPRRNCFMRGSSFVAIEAKDSSSTKNVTRSEIMSEKVTIHSGAPAGSSSSKAMKSGRGAHAHLRADEGLESLLQDRGLLARLDPEQAVDHQHAQLRLLLGPQIELAGERQADHVRDERAV